ncbi:unnamed protein product [Lathyrus oleraceus]
MKRKTLVGMCFFLTVLLAAQEAVAIFKPCAKPSRLFGGKCKGSSDNKQCGNVCTLEEYSASGSCNNHMTCICYHC